MICCLECAFEVEVYIKCLDQSFPRSFHETFGKPPSSQPKSFLYMTDKHVILMAKSRYYFHFISCGGVTID
jgi:hypothetical protein